MDFLYIKALHIIFVVTWFAGLFYIVRLFIYHTEAESRPEIEKNILQTQYKIMQGRLWYGITWPSMILTLVSGSWMIWFKPFLLSQAYFLFKLIFIVGLIFYHLQCHKIFSQLQNNVIKRTSFQLRIWNEVATLFLVAIVFLIVLKSNTGFLWGILGLVIFAAIMMLAIKIYKKKRES